MCVELGAGGRRRRRRYAGRRRTRRSRRWSKCVVRSLEGVGDVAVAFGH